MKTVTKTQISETTRATVHNQPGARHPSNDARTEVALTIVEDGGGLFTQTFPCEVKEMTQAQKRKAERNAHLAFVRYLNTRRAFQRGQATLQQVAHALATFDLTLAIAKMSRVGAELRDLALRHLAAGDRLQPVARVRRAK